MYGFRCSGTLGPCNWGEVPLSQGPGAQDYGFAAARWRESIENLNPEVPALVLPQLGSNPQTQ